MKKLLFAFVLLSGCMTADKLAQKCADLYPPKIETKTDVFVIDSITHETLYVEVPDIMFMDTTECPPSDTLKVIIKERVVEQMPGKVVTNTVVQTKTQTVTVENTAKTALFLNEISGLKSSMAAAYKSKNTWFKLFVASAVLNALFLVFGFIVWKHNKK